jgi:hypothetical protein
MTDLGEKIHRLGRPSFESIGALMCADEAGSVSDEEFDRNLWILLSRQVRSRGSHVSLSKPVLNYYASHLMESDVANGGFAQAAYNIPELFEAAADGYEAIGHKGAAQVIRKAYAMSKGETGEVAKLKGRGAGIGAIFKSFKKSTLADLANDLDGIGWWATADRLAYVRQHRIAFTELE